MACLPAWKEVKAVPTRERRSDVRLMGLEEESIPMTDDIRPYTPAQKPYHTDTASSGYAEQNGVLAKAGVDFMKVLEKRVTIESSLPTLKHKTCAPNRFPSLSNGELAARAEARGACMSEAPVLSKLGSSKPSSNNTSSALVNLNRDRQILTRLQSLQIASVFPFLLLPAELRLMVYEYCITFAGIDKWFDEFWSLLRASKKPNNVKPPLVYPRTPSVLLICKQIYHEAREVLKKQGIAFHHGLLDISGLENLMNVNILTNITSITIDAKGHEMLPREVLPQDRQLMGASWRGHLDMIVGVANALANGHSLKNFTLDLTDKSLHTHTHSCWHKPIRCDYRDQLTEALMHLRKIRAVPNVNLIGVPAAMVSDLKARMRSVPTSFIDLPGELRNEIYALSADWSDISACLTRTMRTWLQQAQSDRAAHPVYPPKSTPTILLLNKQIHREALSILHATPMTFTLPAGQRSMQTQTETLNAMKLIAAPTLARVQHLSIQIDSWEWIYALERFFPSLAERHSLKTFRFVFRDVLKQTFLRQGKRYPDNTLALSLSGLQKVRGVGKVVFEGDLPGVYTVPLKEIMESRFVKGEVLPVLMGVDQEGRVMEVDEE